MIINRKIQALLPKRIVRRIQQKQDQKIRAQQCVQYPIMSIADVEKFPKIYHIKDETWEKVYVAAKYQFNRAYNVLFRHEQQDISILKGSCVCEKSDVVITKDGVVWDKYYNPNFSKITPLDRNVYAYDKTNVWLKKYVNKEQLKGKVVSLLGVYSGVWAHFIVQYLPKLYYAEKAGLFNETVTLLVSSINDENIREIFEQYSHLYPAIRIVEAYENCYYECEELYYMPSASHVDDDSLYLQTCDVLIPKIVKDNLLSHLVQPLIEKVKANAPMHRKIYLVRRDTYRKTTNWEEIEHYFEDQGFYMVVGANMTLLEKAELFYHAEEIVGPYSSAWTNTMFCNGAKGLMLVNIPRSVDSYQVTFAEMGNMNVLQVTGYDLNKSDTHTDNYISLDRIKAAYDELIKKQ